MEFTLCLVYIYTYLSFKTETKISPNSAYSSIFSLCTLIFSILVHASFDLQNWFYNLLIDCNLLFERHWYGVSGDTSMAGIRPARDFLLNRSENLVLQAGVVSRQPLHFLFTPALEMCYDQVCFFSYFFPQIII